MRRRVDGHRLKCRMRGTPGLSGSAAQPFGFRYRFTEVAQTAIPQGGFGRLRFRNIGPALCRLRLHLANRFFQRQSLTRDVCFIKRRRDATQLADKRGPGAVVQRTAILTRVLVEAANRAGNQRVIVSHCTLLCWSTVPSAKRIPLTESCLTLVHVFFQQS